MRNKVGEPREEQGRRGMGSGGGQADQADDYVDRRCPVQVGQEEWKEDRWYIEQA